MLHFVEDVTDVPECSASNQNPYWSNVRCDLLHRLAGSRERHLDNVSAQVSGDTSRVARQRVAAQIFGLLRPCVRNHHHWQFRIDRPPVPAVHAARNMSPSNLDDRWI